MSLLSQNYPGMLIIEHCTTLLGRLLGVRRTDRIRNDCNTRGQPRLDGLVTELRLMYGHVKGRDVHLWVLYREQDADDEAVASRKEQLKRSFMDVVRATKRAVSVTKENTEEIKI